MGKILSFLPYLIIFVASLFQPYDSDLGWHLKYGEYFINNKQILRENIFSTSMPHYNWVNHSWGTDIISYFTFERFGFLGLTLLGALVISLTFFFFSKAAKLTLWDETLLFPLIFFYVEPVVVVGFRSQLLSLLFLGILFFILSSFTSNNRLRLLFLIPLFLVWVNIHGEFMLGIGVCAIWMAFEVIRSILFIDIKNPKNVHQKIIFFIVIFIGIILATLINPYTVGVYIEAFNHFGNPSQHYILEWLPFEQMSQLWWRHIILGVLMFFSIFFMFFNEEHKKKFPLIMLVIFFLGLSFWMKRYAWPTYFMSMLCLSPLSTFFRPSTSKTVLNSSFVILLVSLIIALYVRRPYSQFVTMSWNVYCQSYIHCSPASSEYILEHKLNYNLLTFYNWGGWLIWNYPRIKPSIDGRMSFWKDEKGYSAFSEYYQYEQNLKDINSWKYDVVLMSPEKPMYQRLEELVEKKKWKQVYEDDYAGVFVRNK